MQLLSPNRMRGRMGALTSTIWAIPAGNSPLIVGWLTDKVFANPLAIDRAMAMALGVAGFCAAGSGIYAWRQARLTESGSSRGEAVALRDQTVAVVKLLEIINVEHKGFQGPRSLVGENLVESTRLNDIDGNRPA